MLEQAERDRLELSSALHGLMALRAERESIEARLAELSAAEDKIEKSVVRQCDERFGQQPKGGGHRFLFEGQLVTASGGCHYEWPERVEIEPIHSIQSVEDGKGIR